MVRIAGRIAAAVLGVIVIAIAALLVLSHRPAIPKVGRPDSASFAAAEVARGAGLARLGDCMVCHTRGDGPAYAGGRGVRTPFGTIYATNLTPDIRTGIGGWSRAAFRRAMREGVSRDGAQLYPAFPYDHFRIVSDADLDALYAFLMTRRPTEARAPANALIPPLGFRPLLAAWKLVALKPPPTLLSPKADPQIRRGAYLVAGLGHCGACHTPHDRLGAEETARPLAGGTSEGWYAPPLDRANPAARAWTPDRVYALLRAGLDPDHAAAAGPMGEVSHELAAAPDADVRAISAYAAAQMQGRPAASHGQPVDRARIAAHDHAEGAALFAGACAACHEPGAPMMQQGRPALQLGSPIREPTPRNVMMIVRLGVQPPVGRSGPFMPGFGSTFTDAQMAELVAYLRERFSDEPPWANLVAEAARARKEAP